MSPTDSHRATTLPSGVRVLSERVPAVRSVALGCMVRAGSALEPAPQAGISHLLEHMLFRGTERYRSEEIDQIFDTMGSTLDAETDRESTALSTRVLDHNLDRALDVICQMLWNPRMEQLAAEREVVLEEIAAYEDDPQDRVFDLLGEAVFGSHPLGRPVVGSTETVATLTDADLRAYHARHYRPQDVVIAAAGSVDHDELVATVSALTPSMNSSPAIALDTVGTAFEGPEAARSVSFLTKETEQYHLCVGGPGIKRGDERRFTLGVLEAALGANASSRLFREVRERRGLAYSVFSFSGMYTRAGEIGIYVGTRPDNLAETVATIAGELARLSEDPIAGAELDRSRESMKGRMVLAMESPGARMARLGGHALYGIPMPSIDEVIERIDAVGREQVAELAAELMDPGRLSVVAIGPDREAFRRAIEPLQAVAA